MGRWRIYGRSNGQLAVHTRITVRLIVTWSVLPDRVADCNDRESDSPTELQISLRGRPLQRIRPLVSDGFIIMTK